MSRYSRCYRCDLCLSEFSADELNQLMDNFEACDDEWYELARNSFLYWGAESVSEGIVHVEICCPGRKIMLGDQDSDFESSLEECEGVIVVACEFEVTVEGSEGTDEPTIIESHFTIMEMQRLEGLPKSCITSSADTFERMTWNAIEEEEEVQARKYFRSQEKQRKRVEKLEREKKKLEQQKKELVFERALVAKLECVERELAAERQKRLESEAREERLKIFVGTWMPGENHIGARDPKDVLSKVFAVAELAITAFIYTFTDQEIAKALSMAKMRNVYVRIVADAEQTKKTSRQRKILEELAKRGCYVVLATGSKGGVMHLKSTYVDHILKLSGCYNWTWSAANRNAEELECTIRTKDEVCRLVERSERQCKIVEWFEEAPRVSKQPRLGEEKK